MTNLYYLALNIYQYSFIKPIYREIGGQFLIHKPRALFHLKQSFWGFKSKNPSHGWLRLQPKTIRVKHFDYSSLEGLIISTRNRDLKRNPAKLVAIYIGHGTGDKPYRYGDVKPFEYYLISGNKHIYKIKNSFAPDISEEQIISIGNMRFDDVINDNIDKKKVLEKIGIRDFSLPVILYAPTWKEWGGGTLLDYSYKFIKEFDKKYNLIIRPHYYDWRKIPPVKKFISSNRYKNVYLVDPRNISSIDTMENLSIADLLISDTSSIMYEFLIIKKPIIIIDVDQKLTPMPIEMDIGKVVDHWNGKGPILPLVKENIETNKYADELHDLLFNCFEYNDGKSTQRAVSFLNSLL